MSGRRLRSTLAEPRVLAPVVALVALLVRLIPLPTVFTARGILPGGLADEYYHLRRIVYSVVHFPDVLSFDPYVSFPDGGAIHWPPGFDWTVAAAARLLVGAEDQAAVEAVAAWVPVLLGVAAAVGAALVGRAAFGPVGGVVAGLGLALLPAHSSYSRLGAVDHHVAVALSAVVLLGVAMVWLRTEDRRARRRGPVALGLAFGLPLLVWPGFLIHVAITQLVLVAATLATPDPARARRRAHELAIAHATAAGVVLPFGLGTPIAQYGAWSPLVLSSFQPAWLGGGAAALAAAAALWAHRRTGRARTHRVATAGALGALGIGVALAAAPDLRGALVDASGWFRETEDFQRHVAELRPLDFTRALGRFSHALLAFPAAWLGLAVSAARRRDAFQALLVAWGALLLALTLHQNRFANSFSVPYVLVWAGASAEAVRVLRPRLEALPALAARGAALTAAAALLFSLQPVAAYHAAYLRRSLGVLEQPQAVYGSLPRTLKRLQLGAAWWLARSTPQTHGYLDASVQPRYGILASWASGHLIRYVAQRPLVQDNFGVYGGRKSFARAGAYYASTDEASAVALLEELKVRYVVADITGAGVAPHRYGPLSMTYRLTRLFGTSGQGSKEPRSGERVRIPALRRHRLVYHARSAPGAALHPAPPERAIAVYERVRGARVEGAARPGAEVEAQIRVLTQAGPRHLPRATQPLVYRVRTRAGPSGDYTLTLPYPTDETFSDAVRVAGAYELRSGALRAPLEVPESAVRSGERISGPALTPRAAPIGRGGPGARRAPAP